MGPIIITAMFLILIILFKELKMVTISLILMIISLLIVFTVDTLQKRRLFMKSNESSSQTQ